METHDAQKPRSGFESSHSLATSNPILPDAHFDLHIPSEVFDEVAAELGLALDYFKVPKREKEDLFAVDGL